MVHGVDVRPNHGFGEATLSPAFGARTFKREKKRAAKGKNDATGKGLTRERAKEPDAWLRPHAAGKGKESRPKGPWLCGEESLGNIDRHVAYYAAHLIPLPEDLSAHFFDHIPFEKHTRGLTIICTRISRTPDVDARLQGTPAAPLSVGAHVEGRDILRR